MWLASSDRRRSYLIAALSLATFGPSALYAQDAFDAKSAAHVRNAYVSDMDTVHVKIVALAKAIPSEKYGWRPAPGVRSVAEVLMHVAGEWYFWAPRSMAGNPPANFGDPKTRLPGLEKEVTGKEAILSELDKSWAHCVAQLRAADPAKMTGKFQPWNTTVDAAAFVMSGDMHEHLGQLIAYARSVGVTPPWSK
jgi:uncharacterized damage-inducible protein DinB